jgi:hypothetical protein
MCLEKFCQSVRNQVLDLGTYLWEEDDPSLAQNDRIKFESQCAELAALIARQRGLTARHRAELVELHRRLSSHEKQASFLLKRIEILHRVGDQANAWSHALQLEQLRLVVHHDRARLRSQERSYREHLTRTERLQEKLADLKDLSAL